MLGKLTSAFSSLNTSRDATPPPPPTHDSPARAEQYAQLADKLHHAGVPVSVADCSACDHPCSIDDTEQGAGQVVEIGRPWSGKSYPDYVQDTYGSLPDWPDSIDTDWESDLAGSSQGGRGRIAVVSTGKSDWERDHYDDKSILSHHLHNQISSQPAPDAVSDESTLPYVATRTGKLLPSIYSSSLISQSTDPTDQSLLVFPDWKVVHELENSKSGAEEIWDGLLAPGIGRSGKKTQRAETVGRRRSWTLPYRAVILLCSHKRRDKRCHIAAPLLRSALHTVLEKHDITIDETGSSLACLEGDPLEDIDGTDTDRDDEAQKRMRDIEGISGGEGGEVGIFNINHLGGHRYAGVMLLLFPSGAYISYGRVTPLEIPRIVEETILQGKVVPGLLRNVVLPAKQGEGDDDKGARILSW